MNLKFAVQSPVQTSIDCLTLIFDVFIVASVLVGAVQTGGQRQLPINPVAAALCLLTRPGKRLEVLNGPAVHDIPAKVNWKMAGQAGVLIEHLLIPISSETRAVSVIDQHQANLLGVLEHPHQRLAVKELCPIHWPGLSQKGFHRPGQEGEQKRSAIIQIR